MEIMNNILFQKLINMASTDDLILFAQVVEAGSFSKVAEQNSRTNSVVSKRIGRLEEELRCSCSIAPPAGSP